MKAYLVGAILGLGGLGLSGYYQAQTREVHYHAGILVYVDGVRQDFAKIEYMKLAKCDEHDNGWRGLRNYLEHEQMEKAHLHDMVADVVHVHRPSAKWRDFFANIGYKLPRDKQVVGYVNGDKIERILDYPIKANDSVRIEVGESTRINQSEQVSKERIKEVEAMSESCGE